MEEFNSTRLALARERAGLTKRDLARLVGCSERSIGEWERGDTPPTEENIEKLSEALNRPQLFFFQETLEELPVDAVSFRALTRMRAGDRSRAIALARMAFQFDAWLKKNFNLPGPDVPDLRHHQERPEAAAMALRARWGLGDKPIKSMVALLEFKGVRVFSLAEDCRELNAFAFWQGETPFIFLNNNRSSESSRFDAAHELGHLVLHQHGSPAGRRAEWEANAFAGAFLMPATSVNAYAPRTHSIPRLTAAKHFWNVSLGALAHRLHELGHISEWNYRSLCIEMQKTGLRVSEPESAPRELSQVFDKVFTALRAEGIGKKELAAQFGWTLEELNSLVFGLTLGSLPGGGTSTAPPDPEHRAKLRVVK